jgi:hypothetical protein
LQKPNKNQKINTMTPLQSMKKNSEYVKILLKDLQRKTEIDQKVDYYKAILKAYDLKSETLSKKIEVLEIKHNNSKENYDYGYDLSCLIIIKIELDDAIFEKKKFFEMWLSRGKEYDDKFNILSKDCNDNFDEVQNKAKELAEKNVKLKSHIEKFEKEENPSQRLKNEYYLLIKYEVYKATEKIIGLAFEDYYK